MRTLTIVGTRPEIIRICDWEKDILFTGQHYDYDMGDQFLDEFRDRNLHYLIKQVDTARESDLTDAIKSTVYGLGDFNYVIVHGDTRTALCGAYATQMLKIKIAHIEAGVRCHWDTVEEVIRKKIDRIADINFCPTQEAVCNLKSEGLDGVFVGDVMYDRFLKDHIEDSWDLVFVTIHRFENVENKERLQSLIDSLKEYNQVIFPVHPHTRKKLQEFKIDVPSNVITLEPLGRKDTLRYIKDARLVLTDSGGIQREAYWSGTPCKVLRETDEWSTYTKSFGDGDAGRKIYDILQQKISYGTGIE